MLRRNKLLFICLFFCIFLSMSFVSANDNITLDDSSCNIDYQNKTFNVNNEDSSDSNGIDSINKSKSFTDLNNVINGDLNKSEIILENDYIFQEEYDRNFIGGMGGIFINRSVTIDGQNHVIDASKISKIFFINTTGDVVLKNIIFKNGWGIEGGAILCYDSNLCIIHSTFINNYATFPGGAICSYALNTTVINSTFKHNYVDTYGGSALMIKYGGTIINSTFIDNYIDASTYGMDNAVYYRDVTFNIVNESISYSNNNEGVHDIISFNKNNIIINSTFKNYPKHEIYYNYDFIIPLTGDNSSYVNWSDKNNSCDDLNNSNNSTHNANSSVVNNTNSSKGNGAGSDSINKSQSFIDLDNVINGDLNKSEIILEDEAEGSDVSEPNQDMGNNAATEPNQNMGNSTNVTVPNQDMGNNANNKQNTVRTLHKKVYTKFSPKVIAKNKKFNKKTKVKKYSLTLKHNGKSIKNVWVTLKIKGKTFKAKTNNKGQATFKITKLNKRGEFTAKIIFKGNKYYNSINKNVKIVVK